MVRGARSAGNGKQQQKTQSIEVAEQPGDPELTYDPAKAERPLVFGDPDDEEVEGQA